METKLVSIKTVKANKDNPRVIKDDKFEKLVNSIKEFPQMLEIRPIVVNNDMVVLGGNMRLKACKEAGLKKVHIIKAEDLTEEQQNEFIIKDNVGFGEWEWEQLKGEDWETEKLADWGLDLPNFEEEVNIDFFDVEETNKQKLEKPSASDDNYSTFELIMLHENKLLLIDTLNKVKNEFLFEKQEEALMEILRIYNK